jgi:retron-type reverse transcriptase
MDMYDNVVSKNTKNKSKIGKFDKLYSINIFRIKEFIMRKYHEPCKYNIFLIKEPKYRIIMSQELIDKVVNHLVAEYFISYPFEPTLIEENCATRIGKGTHYALRLFKEGYNYYKNNYDKFYVLKFDISKYFYNIDHEIVKEMMKSKVKDVRAIELISSIIDSTDLDYVNSTITKLKNNEIDRVNKLNIKENEKKLKIGEINKLPLYSKGKGCPIGNMSSQMIATIYLNELDHYIKDNYDVRYIRYMDDGVIMHYDKDVLKRCLSDLDSIITKYKLKLNHKTKIYSSKEEIEFLGFRFSINNRNRIVMKITNKTKKRFKKNIKVEKKMLNDELISFEDYRSVRDSYLGHLKHGDCNRLIYKVVDKQSH